MAQLTSRKTLLRSGSVGAATGVAAYGAAYTLSGYRTRSGTLPAALAAGAVGAGVTAFFETQDTN